MWVQSPRCSDCLHTLQQADGETTVYMKGAGFIWFICCWLTLISNILSLRKTRTSGFQLLLEWKQGSSISYWAGTYLSSRRSSSLLNSLICFTADIPFPSVLSHSRTEKGPHVWFSQGQCFNRIKLKII